MTHVKIIAEAGVNHNGSLALAKKLIDAAVDANVDIVKFQTFKADALASKSAPKAAYQIKTTGNDQSQYEMLKALELSFEDHFELIDYCNKRSIEFLSTPFDLECLDFLVNNLKLKRLKVGSGDMTNAPLLYEMGKTGLPVIMSTGMASTEEIAESLSVLAYGYLGHANPKREKFVGLDLSDEALSALQEKVTLLHCTTAYPASVESLNISALQTLASSFKLPTGFSDHSEGILASVVAVSMGACVIEKHMTLDKTMEGPDHNASLEPDEFKEMVSQIRYATTARGSGEKAPQTSEIKNINVARKSLVAKCDIQNGDILSPDNVTLKRPGSGLSPFLYWDVIGKKAPNDIKQDAPISLSAAELKQLLED